MICWAFAGLSAFQFTRTVARAALRPKDLHYNAHLNRNNAFASCCWNALPSTAPACTNTQSTGDFVPPAASGLRFAGQALHFINSAHRNCWKITASFKTATLGANCLLSHHVAVVVKCDSCSVANATQRSTRTAARPTNRSHDHALL